MGWNLALRMMRSHWVLSKQVLCSVLYVKKIAPDALLRIGEVFRSRENLGGLYTRWDMRWWWLVRGGTMEVIRHGWTWNLALSFPKAYLLEASFLQAKMGWWVCCSASQLLSYSLWFSGLVTLSWILCFLVYCSIFLDFLKKMCIRRAGFLVSQEGLCCHHIWLIIWPWYKIQEWK